MTFAARLSAVKVVSDCPSAYVVEGDTLRCFSIGVRLLGTDARVRSSPVKNADWQ